MPLLTPRFNYRYPSAVRGDGIYIYDADGRRYIDGSSGTTCSNIGHGVTEIARVMAEQAGILAYANRVQFTNPLAQELAEKIEQDWAPSGLGTVWFSSSGSDAVESAIRIARQYHVDRGEGTRYKVVSTWHSYHGSTFGALAASGREGPRALFQPYFTGAWPHVAAPYSYRCPYGDSTDDGCAGTCAVEVEATILHEGPSTIAAFLLEPIVGSTTGGSHASKEYLTAVRETCSKYGVLLIVDEVMSGFGRTGQKFAVDHWGVPPDLIASGKGLGSGYAPIFATHVHDRVMEVLAAGSAAMELGNTYNANPLSCAVGLAVLRFLEENKLVDAAHSRGARLRSRLEGSKRRRSIIGDVRGLGLMQGLEFVSDRGTKEPFPPDRRVAKLVADAALQRGLVLTYRTGTIDGVRGDHIFVTPPLTTTEPQIDEIAQILDSSIADVEATASRRE